MSEPQEGRASSTPPTKIRIPNVGTSLREASWIITSEDAQILLSPFAHEHEIFVIPISRVAMGTIAPKDFGSFEFVNGRHCQTPSFAFPPFILPSF